MRRFFAVAVVASSLFVGQAFAERDPEVDKAIKSRYPDATSEVTGRREINGVKVYQVDIKTKEGDSVAEITEFGDFLLYGVAIKKAVPKTAAETMQGLFKARPEDVDQFRATSYLVDIDLSKKTYRLRFDAVGRLLDIDHAISSKDALKGLDKASDAGAKKAEERALNWNAGLKSEGVYFADDSHEFYLVDLKNKHGKDAQITLTADGNVSSFRNEIAKSDIPEPVQQTMAKLFDTGKVKTAYKAEYQFYEFIQTVGENEITVRVRTNGDIMSIAPRKLDQKEEESPVRKSVKKK
jgi:hypothetical protein